MWVFVNCGSMTVYRGFFFGTEAVLTGLGDFWDVTVPSPSVFRNCWNPKEALASCFWNWRHLAKLFVDKVWHFSFLWGPRYEMMNPYFILRRTIELFHGWRCLIKESQSFWSWFTCVYMACPSATAHFWFCDNIFSMYVKVKSGDATPKWSSEEGAVDITKW